MDVNPYEDLIDSRDVIERINELLRLEFEDGPLEEDDAAELFILASLAEEASGYAADWKYGETLIRDSYFETYAQDLAEDCGMVPKDLAWPCTHIDWEGAARDLRMDYTAVDFAGITYWIR